MRKGDQKIFKNKAKLYHLLNFRTYGYAEDTLTKIFGCDRSSIIYQFRKYQIPEPEQVYSLQRIISKVLPKPDTEKWKTVNGERINLGRKYKDYLN